MTNDLDDLGCVHCNGEIELASDLVLCEVVDVYRHPARIEVVENVSDGYYFEPYLTHRDCWVSETCDEMQRMHADSPPVAQRPPAMLHCQQCMRIFDDEERAVAFTAGSVILDKTRTAYTYNRNEKPRLYCLPCFAPAADPYSDWVEELLES